MQTSHEEKISIMGLLIVRYQILKINININSKENYQWDLGSQRVNDVKMCKQLCVSPTICHTCIMLSSETLQRTQGSFAFQEKSEILAVWPPWMN